VSVVILTSEADSRSIEFQIRKRRLSTYIRSFGDDGQVHLRIKGGRISARVEYWGGLQSFSGTLNTDGKWNGKLTKQLRRERITFLIRKGKIGRRRMNQVSEFLQGDSRILLEGTKTKESKRKDAQFEIKLKVSSELEVYGLVKHKSGSHYTRIELGPGGRWNAEGWVKLTGGKFLFSAERGKCQTRFEGAPRLVEGRGSFS
jgi:hypothetical protein